MKIMTAAPGTTSQLTPGGAHEPYERRRAEETTLYQLVQEYVETFFAQVEQETGAGLPKLVQAVRGMPP